VKIALLSNINPVSLKLRLKPDLMVYSPDGYDAWITDLLAPDSPFYAYSPTDCFVILHSWGNLDQDAAYGALLAGAERLPRCNFYVAVCGSPEIAIECLKETQKSLESEYMWFRVLNGLTRTRANIYPFDIGRIARFYGEGKFYSRKIWYLSSNPFSASGEKRIRDEILSTLDARHKGRKKCLALDLDNTLWGGVIGEDGEDGVALSGSGYGAIYRDFQRGLKKIKETGILLVLASKNNEEDAAAGFKNPHMVLSFDDFIAKKINWRPKSQNLRDIASELNIGLDSIVFVDDDPAERASVKYELPDVTVPDFPEDTCELPDFAAELFEKYFKILDLSAEDVNKHKMYEENIQRERSKTAYSNIDGYLRDMKITLHLERVNEETLTRACQLIQKTNQFNLTSKRYEEQELRQMMQSDGFLFLTGRVKDKFGDNGYSLLIICGLQGKRRAIIDTFLMSCRVMGRTVETAAILRVEEMLKELGAEEIEASYAPTGKNAPVNTFYDSVGYVLVNEDNEGKKTYRFDLSEKRMSDIRCFVSLI
jgi:FkbH-like protein